MLLVPLSGLLIQAQENKLVCQQTIIVLNIIQDVLKFFWTSKVEEGKTTSVSTYGGVVHDNFYQQEV